MVRRVTHCRMCDSGNLEVFLNLGHTPPSDRFLFSDELHAAEVHYPLRVMVCHDCGFIQLQHVVPPEILYRINYPYEMSITKSGSEHFIEMAKNICQEFSIPQGSFVIDVGSNVGVLLSGFKSQGMRVLGVDPAENIAKIAQENGIETLPEFFGAKVAPEIVKQKGRASVITATNVFAHIGDLKDFVSALDVVLGEKGIFVFEAPYVLNLVNCLQYDTIYHEHLGYISVKPVAAFFKRQGMDVFKVEQHPIHGGSLRVFIARKGTREVQTSVNEFIQNEEKSRLYSSELLHSFAMRVAKHRQDLVALLMDLKKQGKRIVGVSAPAKGNTLLNYCKIGTQYLDYLTEKSKLKVGLYSPGMHIPIKPDEVLLEDKPDYALLLAWNFADEIMNNLKSFRENGGKFIIPVPEPRIV